MAQHPPHSRQKAAQPELSQDSSSGFPVQVSGFAVSQDGSSPTPWPGTVLAATAGQAGAGEDAAARFSGAGEGTPSAAKAGATAQRASRARIVTKVFMSMPPGFWLAGEPSQIISEYLR